MPKGTFKFKSEATEAERAEVESHLTEQGALAVRPLTGAETDPDLGLLRVLEFKTPEEYLSALKFLKEHPSIEYAEGPTGRKLIW